MSVKGQYCQNTSFLEVDDHSSASHGWRGILLGRDLLKPQLGKAIGDGKSTKFWTDPWISLSGSKKSMGPTLEEVDSLMVSELVVETTRDWNR